MTHSSHIAPRYPFVLTRHNSLGLVESETTFEGFATYLEDEDTQYSKWEVEVYVTGFTQYLDGKVFSSVTGLKSKDWVVKDLEAFEADCVEAACERFNLKVA